MSPTQSYGERATKFKNPTAKLILETMERKKTNLAVSVDVTTTSDLLAIIDAVSPYICLVKAKSPFYLINAHPYVIQDSY
jgi:orotidine-5'-phosphate decarboxylase